MIFQSFNVINLYFQSKVLSKYAVHASIASLVVSSTLKIILILTNAPLIAFAYVILLDSIVLSAGFLFFYLRNNLSIRSWEFDYSLAKSLLKDSWPLIISGIMISAYMKIDQVMLKEMLGDDAVGQYAAAVRLSEAWYFFPVIISSSLFPAIINAKRINNNLYYSRLQKLYNFMIWLAICIALPVSLCSNWIIDVLYGSEYSQATSVLTVHIWAGVFVFLGVASGKWLVNENLQLFSTINTAVGTFFNIILNYVLIPKIGIVGAAWATLISYFMAAYLMLLFHKKTRINFILMSKSLLFWRIINVENST